MSEVTIIDYGVGNVSAFSNIYKKLNISVNCASTADELLHSKRLILPGVGSFDWAMMKLEDSKLIPTINELVLDKDIPILGVCVGMQMMCESSNEGKSRGLCWIEGNCNKVLDNDATALPLPHMGWNTINVADSGRLFHKIKQNRFYFLHSYKVTLKFENLSIATCNYGSDFTCAFAKNNIFGTQFHPEKSHGPGMQLLQNFSEL